MYKINKNFKTIFKEKSKKFLKMLRNDFFKFLFKIFEIGCIFICLCLFFNWSNDNLIITEDSYTNKNIPEDFNNYKILQISDFNNKKSLSKDLIKETQKINPDVIVITGDYINSERSTQYNIDYSYFEQLAKNYPIYFVTGDQEHDNENYDIFKTKLEDLGIHILDNKSIELTKNTSTINLIGMNDTSFFYENLNAFNNKLKDLYNENNFSILLSHRPDLIDIYTQDEIPLVLTGHALGGQINLPFVGRLYSSNQGFYPDYTNGFYKQENTSMYVSRGIGNTFIPIRLFNRPEINVITLHNK